MTELLYASEIRPSRENFEARCPYCGEWNKFNRASDLETLSPVGFKVVACLHASCRESFGIGGDVVAPTYQMLLNDSTKFMHEKRYSLVVLSVVQAYESFFSRCLQVELGDLPYNREGTENLLQLQELYTKLYRCIKDLPYKPLRNIFLHLAVAQEKVPTLQRANEIVSTLNKHSKAPPDVASLSGHSDPLMAEVLPMLLCSKAHDLRNAIVHKAAYLPSLDEAEEARKEARFILFQLGELFGLETDYLN